MKELILLKLQVVSHFEDIKMLKDETFNEFFSKLSEIRTSMINLAKKVSETKLIRKVMRSLPKRFRMKTTTIESCIDLNTMRVEELVGALQTYEFSLPQPRKNKDLALRTLRKNSDELSDEDSLDKEEHRISKRFAKPKEST